MSITRIKINQDEQVRQQKIIDIKSTLLATKNKRKTQTCIVRELKINTSCLSKVNLNRLQLFFTEAKWLRNAMLASDDFRTFDFSKSVKSVMGLDKHKQEVIKPIEHLPVRLRQTVRDQLISDSKSLSVLHNNGRKTGKLNFVTEVNSIDLPQFNNSWKFKDKKIHVSGIKIPFKVHGFKQVQELFQLQADFANAKLIKKATGYFIQVTSYVDSGLLKLQNQARNPNYKQLGNIGLDFGIKTNITTSDGDKFDIAIKESASLKNTQRELFKKEKGSHNRNKAKHAVRKKYLSIANLRTDKANKIVSFLFNNYSTIYLQDEMIKGWHKGLFGKQVQNSALGTIKQKLVAKGAVLIDRKAPSTQECLKCGKLTKHDLSKRKFLCAHCGYCHKDRDIKAAQTILNYGMNERYISSKNKLPMEDRNAGQVGQQPDLKACGELTNTDSSMDKYHPDRQVSSMKQEALTSIA